MASPMSKQEIIEFFSNKFLLFLNSGDSKMADEIFSQDYKTVVTGTDEEFKSPFGLRPGIEGHAGMVKVMNEEGKNREFKWMIQNIMVDGNTVAVRSEWSCLSPFDRKDGHDKPKHSDPADEMRMYTRVFHYYTMCDGKIASGEILMDWASGFSSIGAFAPPEKIRERYEAGGMEGFENEGCKPS